MGRFYAPKTSVVLHGNLFEKFTLFWFEMLVLNESEGMGKNLFLRFLFEETYRLMPTYPRSAM